jgi:hypothetical protein
MTGTAAVSNPQVRNLDGRIYNGEYRRVSRSAFGAAVRVLIPTIVVQIRLSLQVASVVGGSASGLDAGSKAPASLLDTVPSSIRAPLVPFADAKAAWLGKRRTSPTSPRILRRSLPLRGEPSGIG